MALLSFISDEKLEEFVREVIDKVQAKADKAEVSLYKNVVDPFSSAFDASRQGITVDDWVEQEKARQAQKTLQNALGKFHQKVIGEIPGWHDAGTNGSYDVGNEGQKIIAEIKNKHNTMNSSSAPGVYQKLVGHLQYGYKGQGYTAYLITMVPKSKKRYDKPWSPQLTLHNLREDIRQIDGASFYELATGSPTALRDLYYALPIVFEKVLGSQAQAVGGTLLFAELFDRVYEISS